MVVLLDPTQVFTTNNIITSPSITLTFEGIIYGFYTLLFALCIYILKYPNRPIPHLKLYTPALVPLYALATIGFTLSVANVIQTSAAYVDVLKGGSSLRTLMNKGPAFMLLSGLTHGTFLLSNVITDGVLIYRTYIIWGSRKLVVIVPTIVSVASNALGIAAVSVQLSTNYTSFVDGNYLIVWFLGTVAFNQLLLTFMIAGRIWWISHHIGLHGSSAMRKRVKTIIAITLESGILYTILLIIYQIQNAMLPIAVDLGLYPILIQFAGISPTLIIIRAGLGMSVENDFDTASGALLSPTTGAFPVSSPIVTVHPFRSPSDFESTPSTTAATYNLDIEKVAPFAVVNK